MLLFKSMHVQNRADDMNFWKFQGKNVIFLGKKVVKF